jgi:hypothetical protein
MRKNRAKAMDEMGVTIMINGKKDPLEKMFRQSLKQGIVHIPVSKDRADRDVYTYIIADTHRDDVSIDQQWIAPSDAQDYDDFVPLYMVEFGSKCIEISSEKTLEEIIDILEKENIEVKSILRIQDLQCTRELERERAILSALNFAEGDSTSNEQD